MNLTERFLGDDLSEPFFWLNQPARFQTGNGLEIWTDAKTDFWRRTHYGFLPDNGHACLLTLAGDFTISTRVQFRPQTQYDQCGLMVRVDADNWIKLAAEYEDERISRLGSVVTNLGFSDWATQDIPSDRTEMWQRISKAGSDFLLESSFDGQGWQQMRITHLHRTPAALEAGLYTASPVGKDFWCRFDWLKVEANQWSQEAGSADTPGDELEDDPRFLARIEQSRRDLAAGRYVRLEDLPD